MNPINNKSPINDNLPKELCNKIDDMICTKIVNSDKKSNELILIFELTEKAINVHDKLMQWLFRCLDTISDKVCIDNQYQWNIISQIKDNDYHYEEDDELENEEDNKTLINTIMVAIHITDDSYMSFNNNGLTIPYNYSSSMSLSPDEIMNCLTNEPGFIMKIGVSAVSSDVMMKWWAEMISTEPNCLEIGGKGYMVHPMWMKLNDNDNSSDWGSWIDIRERSFTFGWKGYSSIFK